MGILAKPLGFLLSWLYDIIGNYGIALIVVTIIVSNRSKGYKAYPDTHLRH